MVIVAGRPASKFLVAHGEELWPGALEVSAFSIFASYQKKLPPNMKFWPEQSRPYAPLAAGTYKLCTAKFAEGISPGQAKSEDRQCCQWFGSVP